MTVDEVRRLVGYLDPLLVRIDAQAAEIQRLEARIAALTAPKEPSQEAIEWAREEIKRTGQKPPAGLTTSMGAKEGEEV